MQYSGILGASRRHSQKPSLEGAPEAEADDPSIDEEKPATDGLQTFVFSATLSKDLQRNLKKPMRPNFLRRKRQDKPASTLGTSLLLPQLLAALLIVLT